MSAVFRAVPIAGGVGARLPHCPPLRLQSDAPVGGSVARAPTPPAPRLRPRRPLQETGTVPVFSARSNSTLVTLSLRAPRVLGLVFESSCSALAEGALVSGADSFSSLF